jgi:hypothetical protein
LLSAHIVAMSQPNGYDEFDEEEQIDLQAELDEGFAEIEQKCVQVSLSLLFTVRLQPWFFQSGRRRCISAHRHRT